MTSTWWDAEGLAALSLDTEAALAEYEEATGVAALATVAVDVAGLLPTATLPDIDQLERRLDAWAALEPQLRLTPIDQTLVDQAASLVVELRLPATTARSGWCRRAGPPFWRTSRSRIAAGRALNCPSRTPIVALGPFAFR